MRFMQSARLVLSVVLVACAIALAGCGTASRGLGYFSSEGLVDEYAIPQNRSLAQPTDFSRLPTPQNPSAAQAQFPSQDEIESLVFTLEPEEVEEYVPITVVSGPVPEYQPIGRIVASGSNGAASQAFVSTQTNASGSLFPVYQTATDSQALAVSSALAPSLAPVPFVAEAATPPISADGLTTLSAEDVAALSALAVGAPVSVNAAQPVPTNGAQMVTSLPAGVTVVGSPVVLPR